MRQGFTNSELIIFCEQMGMVLKSGLSAFEGILLMKEDAGNQRAEVSRIYEKLAEELEQTGILNVIAEFIGKISGSNAMLMVAIILWISAIASAFVDNIPFAATMIPVIKALAASSGVDLSILAWTLAMGTDIGGSATPIGASANVVGISIASKNGHIVGWGKYCKYLAPATVMVILICMIGIYLRYF